MNDNLMVYMVTKERMVSPEAVVINIFCIHNITYKNLYASIEPKYGQIFPKNELIISNFDVLSSIYHV